MASLAGIATRINAGNGNDLVTVLAVDSLATLTIDLQIGAGDLLKLGDGSLTNLLGDIRVIDADGVGIAIDDTASGIARRVTLDANVVTYSDLFSLDDSVATLSSLTLSGSNAGNSYLVIATKPGVTTLNTGLGDDTTVVTGTSAMSALTIQGQHGTDSVTLSGGDRSSEHSRVGLHRE